MIIGFFKKFVQPILDGTKIHTIREDKSDRWNSGKHIHFATGVRSKKYNCFKEDTCISIQKIKIRWKSEYVNDVRIWIDDIPLNLDQIKKLAKNDGFYCLAEFLMWFNSDFDGKIIHWTDYRY